MKFADLHIHSNFSDSNLSCEDIFKKAVSEGLSCISIVDHDSLDAYLKEDLMTLSKKYRIELIRGIELSAQYKDREVHLLGYFPNCKLDGEFLVILEKLKQDRFLRILKMIDKLSSLGVKINLDEFKDFVGSRSLSRLHLAAFLEEKRLVRDIKEVFSKYIGTDKPAYVGRFRYNLAEAIKVLKKAKALVFLAHPLGIDLEKEVKDFIRCGLDGIETFYPSYSQNLIDSFRNKALENNLLISGGSDSHGRLKRYCIGSIKLPYQYVERIKDAFR